jgi:hypothetical protein
MAFDLSLPRKRSGNPHGMMAEGVGKQSIAASAYRSAGKNRVQI